MEAGEVGFIPKRRRVWSSWGIGLLLFFVCFAGVGTTIYYQVKRSTTEKLVSRIANEQFQLELSLLAGNFGEAYVRIANWYGDDSLRRLTFSGLIRFWLAVGVAKKKPDFTIPKNQIPDKVLIHSLRLSVWRDVNTSGGLDAKNYFPILVRCMSNWENYASSYVVVAIGMVHKNPHTSRWMLRYAYNHLDKASLSTLDTPTSALMLFANMQYSKVIALRKKALPELVTIKTDVNWLKAQTQTTLLMLEIHSYEAEGDVAKANHLLRTYIQENAINELDAKAWFPDYDARMKADTKQTTRTIRGNMPPITPTRNEAGKHKQLHSSSSVTGKP
jgi:hypothetical protein